jgi:hypothetical protein
MAPELPRGHAVDEYKALCELIRMYSLLRFYQLALLLGTTGSIVTALSSTAVRASVFGAAFLKGSAVFLSLVFLVMEFRSTTYWHQQRSRVNELCGQLGFQAFPVHSRWSPLTTSGAGFYLHVVVAGLWSTSLFFHL